MSEAIHKFEYSVQPVAAESFPELLPNGGFEATTPYRRVTWLGETEQEAIGAMLYGLCDLAKRGYLDPSAPHAPGGTTSTPEHEPA